MLASGQLDLCGRDLICPISGFVCQQGVPLGGKCSQDANYLTGSKCGNPLVCPNGTCVEPFPATCQ